MDSHWLAMSTCQVPESVLSCSRENYNKREKKLFCKDKKSFWKAELDGYALVRAGRQKSLWGGLLLLCPLMLL